MAVAIAQLTSGEMATCDHGLVAKTKRVIMDRETYPKRWKLGPRALQKQKLIETGKLDPKGKPNSSTPKEWMVYYQNEDNNNINKKDKLLVEEVVAEEVPKKKKKRSE